VRNTLPIRKRIGGTRFECPKGADVIHSIKNGIESVQRLTVAELLVLTVIVGLIVAIAIPAYQSIA
jgi:hypothetical protein